MYHDPELPPAPTALYLNGVEVSEGQAVTMDDDPEEGEVWGVDINGRVYVSWPVQDRPGGYYRYVQEWHDLADLKIVE